MKDTLRMTNVKVKALQSGQRAMLLSTKGNGKMVANMVKVQTYMQMVMNFIVKIGRTTCLKEAFSREPMAISLSAKLSPKKKSTLEKECISGPMVIFMKDTLLMKSIQARVHLHQKMVGNMREIGSMIRSMVMVS